MSKNLYKKLTKITKQENSFRKSIIPFKTGNLIIFLYNYLNPEIFKTELHKEMRGITFYEDKNKNTTLVARPFKKFFHWSDYHTEEEFKKVNIYKITEKLDGSMIFPFMIPNDNTIYWKTKASIDWDGLSKLKNYLTTKPNYLTFIRTIIEQGYTPIFEFWHHDFPIVLQYKNTFLKLISIRNIQTGELFKFKTKDELKIFGDISELELPKIYNYTLDELLKLIQIEQKSEGWVIYAENNEIYKIKTKWYFQIHFIFNARLKDVIVWTRDNKIDDIMAMLQERKSNMLEQVLVYYTKTIDYINYISKISNQIQQKINKLERKEKYIRVNELIKTYKLPNKISRVIVSSIMKNDKEVYIFYRKENKIIAELTEEIRKTLPKEYRETSNIKYLY